MVGVETQVHVDTWHVVSAGQPPHMGTVGQMHLSSSKSHMKRPLQ